MSQKVSHHGDLISWEIVRSFSNALIECYINDERWLPGPQTTWPLARPNTCIK